VPQWTAGGVRQHGRAGICWEYIKLLLSAAQGRGYWKHRKGLGKLQHWTAVYAWRLATVAQGFARTPLTRPFSWPPSSAVVKEPPRVFGLCLDHHVSAFDKVGVCSDIS
jgi:hypothetical protein